MRILVLSAYHAASHDYWLQGLQAHLPQIQWRVLTMPPRYFNWRIRGNPLSWFSEQRHLLDDPVDLVIATSTVDIATLRGLVPALRNIPWVAYFHENQFAYPPSPQGSRQQQIEPQMVNLYAALAADQLWFNSRYNLDTLIAGCEALCRKLPDQVPENGWFECLRQKSRVLPVPLRALDSVAGREEEVAPEQPLRLVWNHRWEYDKGVAQLEALVTALERGRQLVELTLLGQRFRTLPEEMKRLLAKSGNGYVRVVDTGYVADRAEYLAELGRQQVVLSTTLHDFQGLAVMEAVQAGCVPLLPDRLCYPEFFADAYLYPSRPGLPADEAMAVVARLSSWRRDGLPPCPSLASLAWDRLATDYQRAIDDAVSNILPREPVS
ncbi:DUF3524 domain-containing protein [Litorivivens sp.]|uniref:tRNA-queuosine alpha-mannosyltransferase domain-containing protein n=4 Tax=Litorivivens sp. TaxID=2020868 RepID=UPI003568986E